MSEYGEVEETLMEARSGSDVQIDRQIWQKLDNEIGKIVETQEELKKRMSFKQ
ncbi:3864_t:CDS:2 [Rhizophagus irregularis]|nr:3864_t:CDS:2 [Rhizophagus irregularis]